MKSVLLLPKVVTVENYARLIVLVLTTVLLIRNDFWTKFLLPNDFLCVDLIENQPHVLKRIRRKLISTGSFFLTHFEYFICYLPSLGFSLSNHLTSKYPIYELSGHSYTKGVRQYRKRDCCDVVYRIPWADVHDWES